MGLIKGRDDVQNLVDQGDMLEMMSPKSFLWFWHNITEISGIITPKYQLI